MWNQKEEVTQPGSLGQGWPRERTEAGLPPEFLTKAAVSHCAHSLVPSQSYALAGRIHIATKHVFSSRVLGQISPGVTLHSSHQASLKYPPGGPPQPCLLHLLSIPCHRQNSKMTPKVPAPWCMHLQSDGDLGTAVKGYCRWNREPKLIDFSRWR